MTGAGFDKLGDALLFISEGTETMSFLFTIIGDMGLEGAKNVKDWLMYFGSIGSDMFKDMMNWWEEIQMNSWQAWLVQMLKPLLLKMPGGEAFIERFKWKDASTQKAEIHAAKIKEQDEGTAAVKGMTADESKKLMEYQAEYRKQIKDGTARPGADGQYDYTQQSRFYTEVFNKAGNQFTNMDKSKSSEHGSKFYKMSLNSRVTSITEGVVTAVKDRGDRGWTVMVRNVDGTTIKYQRLRKSFVKKGDTIVKGKAIGVSGSQSKKSTNKKQEGLRISMTDEAGGVIDADKYVQNIYKETKEVDSTTTTTSIKSVNNSKWTQPGDSDGNAADYHAVTDAKIAAVGNELSKMHNDKPASTLLQTVDHAVGEY